MESEKDRYFLELALQEAVKALGEDTYPVGAVIVDGDGQMVATDYNRVQPWKEAAAHSVMEAIRNAGYPIPTTFKIWRRPLLKKGLKERKIALP